MKLLGSFVLLSFSLQSMKDCLPLRKKEESSKGLHDTEIWKASDWEHLQYNLKRMPRNVLQIIYKYVVTSQLFLPRELRRLVGWDVRILKEKGWHCAPYPVVRPEKCTIFMTEGSDNTVTWWPRTKDLEPHVVFDHKIALYFGPPLNPSTVPSLPLAIAYKKERAEVIVPTEQGLILFGKGESIGGKGGVLYQAIPIKKMSDEECIKGLKSIFLSRSNNFFVVSGERLFILNESKPFIFEWKHLADGPLYCIGEMEPESGRLYAFLARSGTRLAKKGVFSVLALEWAPLMFAQSLLRKKKLSESEKQQLAYILCKMAWKNNRLTSYKRWQFTNKKLEQKLPDYCQLYFRSIKQERRRSSFFQNLQAQVIEVLKQRDSSSSYNTATTSDASKESKESSE